MDIIRGRIFMTAVRHSDCLGIGYIASQVFRINNEVLFDSTTSLPCDALGSDVSNNLENPRGVLSFSVQQIVNEFCEPLPGQNVDCEVLMPKEMRVQCDLPTAIAKASDESPMLRKSPNIGTVIVIA